MLYTLYREIGIRPKVEVGIRPKIEVGIRPKIEVGIRRSILQFGYPMHSRPASSNDNTL